MLDLGLTAWLQPTGLGQVWRTGRRQANRLGAKSAAAPMSRPSFVPAPARVRIGSAGVTHPGGDAVDRDQKGILNRPGLSGADPCQQFHLQEI